MRVIVDVEKCCGAGQCVLLVPQVFDQQDDGIVKLLDPTPPKQLHAAVCEAASVCPTSAIRVDETDAVSAAKA
ncbi:MAG: ferredoxin [Deltaproteobacteria bacterium]|nr:ferredoxin [Deltaproteobacteria bacterium]